MPNWIEKAEKQTKTDITHTQKLTGDYPKGKVNVRGVSIMIENPKGSIRSGVDSFGVSWKSTLPHTYGYIQNTVGSDGDEIDVFIGPLASSRQILDVYVVNQIDPLTRQHDEYKVLLGFGSKEEAKEAYLSSYEKGWSGLGSIKAYSQEDFLNWVSKYHVSRKRFSNKAEVKKIPNKTILIKLIGEVIEDVTLADLQSQVSQQVLTDLEELDTVIVEIASPGGDVAEGIKIMMYFDYLSSLGINVVTFVTANAYSIASLIMLAADKVLIAKDADVMVHNPMIPELTMANANELEIHIQQLRELESTMYEIYEVFTDLTIDDIKKLMDNETYISSSEAIELGFADEVANIPKRPKVMLTKNNFKLDMRKTLNILNKAIALVGNSNVVNQMYYDEKGGAIEIYQQDPAQYMVGDRTSVEEGQFKLADGSVVTVEDYVITAIDKGQTPVEANVDVPSTDEGATSNPDTAIVPEAPIVPSTDETQAALASPGATPVVVEEEQKPAASFNEGPAPEQKPAAAAEGEGTSEGASTPVVAEVTPEQWQETCARIDALEKMVKELVEAGATMRTRMEESAEFEELTAKAIDVLAENTASNFKPVARATEETQVGGADTIFQRLKRQRGI